MSRFTFRAMGTEIEAWTDAGGCSDLRDWFEEVEHVCSRFRPDSELSRLNRDPSPVVALGGILGDVIAAGWQARLLSHGLVDIGVGSVVEDWGYDRTFERIEHLDLPPVGRPPADWHLSGSLLHRVPGVALDLGGIAKGWCCDRAVEEGLATVVSAGGDLRSLDPETTVSVIDPTGSTIARVRVGSGALATSSTARRRWRVGDTEVSHLIDPRTMTPVDTPVVQASVVADNAVAAETGAKAVLLLGVDGLAWADEQSWISSAMVVWHDGSVYATIGIEVAA